MFHLLWPAQFGCRWYREACLSSISPVTFCNLKMFENKEKSVQSKQASSSPEVGLWQQVAVTCDSVQRVAILTHERCRLPRCKNTCSAVKILFRDTEISNVTFSIIGLIQVYLSFGTFGVSRIQKDSSIHQCAMHISHHRSYVPPTIRWTAILQKEI